MSKNAAISLGVFLTLLVLTLASRDNQVRAGVRELTLPPIDQNAVTSIEVTGKKSALLKKDGETWTVSAVDAPDTRFPAEMAAVNRALGAIADLEPGAFVTARASKHEELQVEGEKALKVTISTGSRTVRLSLGRSAKGGGSFIRLLPSDDVFIAKGALGSALSKDVKAWRKRRLIDGAVGDVKSVAIVPAGGAKLTLEQTKTGEGEDEEGTWKLSADTVVPAEMRVDENAISRLARAVVNVRAVDYVDEGAGALDTGLANGTKATVTLENGSSATMVIGKENADKKVYAQIEGSPQLYLVSSFSAKQLNKSVGDLRDLTLLTDVDESKVKGWRIAAEGKTLIELAKAEGAWTATSGAADDFDPTTVAGKLSGLLRAKGTRFIGPKAEANADLAGALTLTLTLDDDSTRTVRFGGAVKEGDQKNLVYVEAPDGLVYAISSFQKDRYQDPAKLFQKVALPPGGPGAPGGMGMPGMPGGAGGIQGLESLPPEVRKQLEQQLRQQGMPQK